MCLKPLVPWHANSQQTHVHSSLQYNYTPAAALPRSRSIRHDGLTHSHERDEDTCAPYSEQMRIRTWTSSAAATPLSSSARCASDRSRAGASPRGATAAASAERRRSRRGGAAPPGRALRGGTLGRRDEGCGGEQSAAEVGTVGSIAGVEGAGTVTLREGERKNQVSGGSACSAVCGLWASLRRHPLTLFAIAQ